MKFRGVFKKNSCVIYGLGISEECKTIFWKLHGWKSVFFTKFPRLKWQNSRGFVQKIISSSPLLFGFFEHNIVVKSEFEFIDKWNPTYLSRVLYAPYTLLYNNFQFISTLNQSKSCCILWTFIVYLSSCTCNKSC